MGSPVAYRTSEGLSPLHISLIRIKKKSSEVLVTLLPLCSCTPTCIQGFSRASKIARRITVLVVSFASFDLYYIFAAPYVDIRIYGYTETTWATFSQTY